MKIVLDTSAQLFKTVDNNNHSLTPDFSLNSISIIKYRTIIDFILNTLNKLFVYVLFGLGISIILNVK
jgi:hypothetical protein